MLTNVTTSSFKIKSIHKFLRRSKSLLKSKMAFIDNYIGWNPRRVERGWFICLQFIDRGQFLCVTDEVTYKQTSTFTWERGLRTRIVSAAIVPIHDNENNALLSLVLLGKLARWAFGSKNSAGKCYLLNICRIYKRAVIAATDNAFDCL